MNNVLITGGAGFIGSNLAEKLINQGWNVFIIDIKQDLRNIQEFEDKIKYIHMDIREPNIKDLFKKYNFDGVIHLAAISRVIWCEQKPELCKSTNIFGTKNLLDAIISLDKKPWFIFGSSREVYGESKDLPVKESFPKNPINIYGFAKLTGENMTKEYAIKNNLKSIILRFSNVYGNERDILDRVIPKFILNAIRGKTLEIQGGEQIFDFTHISDTINGIVSAIKLIDSNNLDGVEDLHILTGTPTSITFLAKYIVDSLNSDSDIIFTKPRNYDVIKFYGDPEKAKQLIGFKSNIDIKTGLEKTIKRFKDVLL